MPDNESNCIREYVFVFDQKKIKCPSRNIEQREKSHLESYPMIVLISESIGYSLVSADGRSAGNASLPLNYKVSSSMTFLENKVSPISLPA